MACKLYNNPITNTSSDLHSELLSYLPEEVASQEYALLTTPDFLSAFGNWMDNPKDVEGRVSETGEPILNTHKNGYKYFLLKDNTKHWVNKPLSNLSAQHKQALVTNSLQYLLGEETINKSDITSLNFGDLYKPSKDTGEVNVSYILLKGNRDAMKEIEELIQIKLGIYSTKNSDRQDYQEEGDISTDALENDRVLDLRSSVNKNSKDNASSNTKFLLSLLPKNRYDSKGNIELETVKFELEGVTYQLPIYNEFHEIWNYFEEALAGIYPYYNGATLDNIYDKMIDKLKSEYSGANATVDYAISELLDNKDKPLPEWKKNQFVQAFIKAKVNYYTVTIDGSDNKMALSFIDSKEVTSRENKVRNELLAGVFNGNLFNNNTGEYNADLAKGYLETLKANKIALEEFDNTSYTLENYNTSAKYIQGTLSKVGVNVNIPAVLTYMDSFNDEMYGNALSAFQELEYLLEKLSTSKAEDFKSIGSNPIRNEAIIKAISTQESKFRKDLSENTVLGPENKIYWAYSQPSYLDIKLDKLKKNLQRETGNSAFYKNSVWLNRWNKEPSLLEETRIATFLNLKKKDIGDAGVDNKSINAIDQTIEFLNKAVLAIREDYSIYATPTPADKGRNLGFYSSIFIPTRLGINDEGGYVFSKDIINTYKGYFIDEYTRIQEEYERLEAWKLADDEGKAEIEKDLSQYYHFVKGELFKTLSNGEKVPAGNAFKFTLFDDINFGAEEFKNINKKISDELGTPLFLLNEGNDTYLKPTLTEKDLLASTQLEKYITTKLNQAVDNTVDFLKVNNVLDDSFTNQQFIDEKIYTNYLEQAAGNEELAIKKFLADSVLNQHVANVEYSKVFSGDYAFYKSLDDYSKRVPATYTDGTLLNLKDSDSPTYNMAVIDDVKVDTDLYSNVDTTDAQGWITHERWKFLVTRLNKWSPIHEEAYNRMKNGEELTGDYKMAAQPLKGVYFDTINGVPTYVKYSQAVLFPAVVKGKSIENLYNKMVADGIDEVVALSGVKTGAAQTTKVDDGEGFIADLELNPMTLNNHSWKLQQDLTPKGLKNTLLGSQMQKNIISDIVIDKIYKGKKGSERIIKTMDLISKLSDIGLDQISKQIGLNKKTGEIENREVFYEKFIDEIAARDGDYNTIEALKKEYPLSLILSNRNKFQSLIASMINTAAVKLKTNGGSFIQMSGFGWDVTDAKENGVVMLVDETKLKAPRKVGKTVKPGQVFMSHQQISKYIPNYRELSMTELNSMIDEKLKTVIGYRIPNQALSSNDALEIVGILPDSMGDTIIPYIDITTKTGSDFDIDKMFLMLPHISPIYDKLTYEKAREYLIENNISNQDMYAELEDLGYNVEDFKRIDVTDVKSIFITEVMFDHNSVYFEDFQKKYPVTVERLDFFTDEKGKETKKGLENELIQEYIDILTSIGNFDRLTNALDSNELQDDLERLHGKVLHDSGFEFFSPLYQIKKKFDNTAGKTGTGITANHMSDHVLSQLAKVGLNTDLGVGHYKDGITDLSQIYDTDGKTRISEVLSWFLTAYVDIAKDPYITNGNYNAETSNVTFLLLRSGVPLSWINRFVGQDVLKEYAKLEMSKDSKFNPNNRISFTKLRNEYLKKLENITSTKYKDNFVPKLKDYKELGNAVKKDKRFKPKYMEKYAPKFISDQTKETKEYIEDQLIYLEVYNAYNRIGRKLNSSVIHSKADVNGSPSSIAENMIYDLKLKALRGDELFYNLDVKFDKTFLGKKHSNSVDIVRKIYEKELVTANPKFGKQVLKDYYYTGNNQFDGNIKRKLRLVESNLFGYIALQSSFFNLTNEQVNAMMTLSSPTSIQKRVENAKIKYPNNILLDALKAKTQDKNQFVKMDNLNNKPSSFKSDLALAWEELYREEKDLANDLVKYSFVTSNFVFDGNAFFEYIPHSIVYDQLRNTIEEFENKNKEDYIEEFFDYFYLNNPNEIQKVEMTLGKQQIGNADFVHGTGGNLITSKVDAPIVKTSKGVFKQTGIFGIEQDAETFTYRKVKEHGYHKNGFHIYEKPKQDIFKEVSSQEEENIQKFLLLNDVASIKDLKGIGKMPTIKEDKGDSIPKEDIKCN